MRKLFGTDGIRGVANVEPMTCETALKLGRAAGHVFQENDRRHRIVIGKDTRLSGYMIESALVAGICSMGVDALLVGPMPTPAVALITRSLRADAGVVISASHNPYEDNGIKFFSRSGFKLPDEIEERMEYLISTGEIDHIRPTASKVGKAFRIDDAVGRYIEFVKTSIPKGMTFDGIRVVVDCANGASYKVAPIVLSELGADVIPVNVNPDGTNINKKCGSIYPEQMCAKMKQEKAHVGMAFDGDADRVVLADEHGVQVDGDQIMAMCAIDMIREGRLPQNTLVTTVMSNLGLEHALKPVGGKLVKTKVGDRYVVEEMLRGKYTVGGEQSGHIVFLDYNTTGDGMISALQVLALMRKTDKSLNELASCMMRFPQVLINVTVQRKEPIDTIPRVKQEIDMAKDRLGDSGRILVRYSGTEPLARVMVEGRDTNLIHELAESIAAAIRAELG
ncbi:MAG: phosphoglucosamine mutase [Candidatus Abyssobacteria bacterium SURF_5]|uniref:Phosphoglucosamine mutase n=1 Tax=Abyssobacteria bacterium (strain SURF_5) TaxID=2093360 RepID=A0A3A4P5N3_ABYX5|nr:MAG: phosphoglucosamine mutase [Candidatus Abyssubacteria bacterium SURF_5]